MPVLHEFCSGLYRFYRPMLRRSRYRIAIASRPSVRLSVYNVEVLSSHKLEYLKNNFMADLSRVVALCRPEHHRSTSMGTAQILA